MTTPGWIGKFAEVRDTGTPGWGPKGAVANAKESVSDKQRVIG